MGSTATTPPSPPSDAAFAAAVKTLDKPLPHQQQQQEQHSSSSSKKLWQQHLQEVDQETQGWRCYELARLLREQCSEETLLLLHLREQQPAAAAAGDARDAGGDRLCERVVEGLRECREEIYKELGSITPPAMRPIPPLVNRPHWLKEPAWFEQLQQQQRQQQQLSTETGGAEAAGSAA
ncbi:hypothetical protein Esti_000648 [Eimeria stiedai]